MQNFVARWRSARRLHPIYRHLATAAVPPLALPSLTDAGSSEEQVLGQLEAWFDQIDAALTPEQFRAGCHRAGFAESESELQALAQRVLLKGAPPPADRDKLDFLLARYLELGAPPSFAGRDLTLPDVAEVLEPVVGKCDLNLPEWLTAAPLLVATADACATCADLVHHRVVEAGRELRAAVGPRYFTPLALVALTWLQARLAARLTAIAKADAQFVVQGLAALHERGDDTIQVRSGGAAEEEPVELLLQAWSAWQVPPFAEISTSEILERLALSREAVEGSMLPPMERRVRDLTSSVVLLTAGMQDLQAQMRALATEVHTILLQTRPPAAGFDDEPQPPANGRSHGAH